MTRYALYDMRSRATPFQGRRSNRSCIKPFRIYRCTPPDGKTAIVIDTSLKYGVVKMYDALAELEGIATQTRPFDDMAEAVQWLGKPIATIPGLASPAPTVG